MKQWLTDSNEDYMSIHFCHAFFNYFLMLTSLYIKQKPQEIKGVINAVRLQSMGVRVGSSLPSSSTDDKCHRFVPGLPET